MSRRNVVDRRWEGVELPSLFRVLLRVHGSEEAMSRYDEAKATVLATGRYGEWEAVKTELGQLLGFRRLNPKDWFVQHTESGEVRGAYGTKRHALHALGTKSASKTETSGIYSIPGWYIFTRDRAGVLGINEEEL